MLRLKPDCVSIRGPLETHITVMMWWKALICGDLKSRVTVHTQKRLLGGHTPGGREMITTRDTLATPPKWKHVSWADDLVIAYPRTSHTIGHLNSRQPHDIKPGTTSSVKTIQMGEFCLGKNDCIIIFEKYLRCFICKWSTMKINTVTTDYRGVIDLQRLAKPSP